MRTIVLVGSWSVCVRYKKDLLGGQWCRWEAGLCLCQVQIGPNI